MGRALAFEPKLSSPMNSFSLHKKNSFRARKSRRRRSRIVARNIFFLFERNEIVSQNIRHTSNVRRYNKKSWSLKCKNFNVQLASCVSSFACCRPDIIVQGNFSPRKNIFHFNAAGVKNSFLSLIECEKWKFLLCVACARNACK